MTMILYPCDFCGATFKAPHDADVVLCPRCGYEIISEENFCHDTHPTKDSPE